MADILNNSREELTLNTGEKWSDMEIQNEIPSVRKVLRFSKGPLKISEEQIELNLRLRRELDEAYASGEYSVLPEPKVELAKKPAPQKRGFLARLFGKAEQEELAVPEKTKEEIEIERGDKIRKRLYEIFEIVDMDFSSFCINQKLDINGSPISVQEKGQYLIDLIYERARNLNLVKNECKTARKVFLLIKDVCNSIAENFNKTGEVPPEEIIDAFLKVREVMRKWQKENNIESIDITDEEMQSGGKMLSNMSRIVDGACQYDTSGVDVTAGGGRIPHDIRFYKYMDTIPVDAEQWEELVKQMELQGKSFLSDNSLAFFVIQPGYIVPQEKYAQENIGIDDKREKCFVTEAKTINFIPPRKKK